MDRIGVPEAAKILGVSRVRVHQLIALKRLTADKWGRDWMITKRSLEAVRASPRKSGRPAKKPRP